MAVAYKLRYMCEILSAISPAIQGTLRYGDGDYVQLEADICRHKFGESWGSSRALLHRNVQRFRKCAAVSRRARIQGSWTSQKCAAVPSRARI